MIKERKEEEEKKTEGLGQWVRDLGILVQFSTQ